MKPIIAFPESSSHALKEWAIVCEAIHRGRQHLLFRTGGIEESTDGFQPLHDSFWLFPTRFHQTVELVTDEFADEVARENLLPLTETDDSIQFQLFCQVAEVFRVEQFEKLETLRQFHILKEDVLRQRFEYRTPGLFVLVIQAAILPNSVSIPHANRYDGCKSWVELDGSLSTQGLEPITSHQNVSKIVHSVTELIGPN